ncbi:hypothetical protein BDW22DRAFT_1398185 [Trametopsis cervina]|nr:hypothetical protein BDW22DRAFT_1398185 [Trametopsis cervina]
MPTEPSHAVLTALSLPATSTFPSEGCLQWSADGQIILPTRKSIVILTPQLGIAVEPSSVLKQAHGKSFRPNAENSVEWFHTMIEWDKTREPYQWAMECQDWGAVSLGFIDVSFIAVACSPSNITGDSGSIVAALDSNMEVFLYKSIKNHITGIWQKLGGLLGVLASVIDDIVVAEDVRNPTLSRTLRKQATSIAWSPIADFRLTPVLDIDSSLLAVGTRAGTVNLMRLQNGGDSVMVHVSVIEVSNERITHLAWSFWTPGESGTSEALLACGISNGAIVVFKITQTLVQSSSSPSFSQEFDLDVSHENLSTVCHPTRRCTSALRWINLDRPTLVFGKPGVLTLWRLPDPSGLWDGVKNIRLKTQKVSSGSTALAPITGLANIATRDALVVSLSDGSFHVIKNISTEPSLSPDDGSDEFSSHRLSVVARQHFIAVEEEDIQRIDVNYTHGMTSFDDDSAFLWIHEALRPNDFNYKHEAQHTNKVVLAHLFPGVSDSELLKDVGNIITNAACTSGEMPFSLLRRVFTRLHEHGKVTELAEGILETLEDSHSSEAWPDLTLELWKDDFSVDLRRQFQSSLRTHIFGDSSLLSQRLKVALSGFCENHCSDEKLRERFHEVTARILHTIWCRVLSILIRHITVVMHTATSPDILFIRRLAVHGAMTGEEHIKAEAETLNSVVEKVAPIPDAATSNLDELCPACNAFIPFLDLQSAICPNGHRWLRCSVTSFVLATPMVRTCIGCSRKAFLPPRPGSQSTPWLPAAARSWLVEDLLEAARRCFFCGNSFVTLL